MPRRSSFLRALTRLTTSTPSPEPAFQSPFIVRPSLPIIRIIPSSSSTSPISPFVLDSPVSPISPISPTLTPPTTTTPSPPGTPDAPHWSPVTPSYSPVTSAGSSVSPPISPLTPPPSAGYVSNPQYRLKNKYLRYLVLLLTPSLIDAANAYLQQKGYGSGTKGAVTEDDELRFFGVLDEFLCLLDAHKSVMGVAPIVMTREDAGESDWSEGVRTKYLVKLLLELEVDGKVEVERWAEMEMKEMGVGEYIKIVDGFLGVLEGRDVLVEEKQGCMRGALSGVTGEGVEGRLQALEDDLLGVLEDFDLGEPAMVL